MGVVNNTSLMGDPTCTPHSKAMWHVVMHVIITCLFLAGLERAGLDLGEERTGTYPNRESRLQSYGQERRERVRFGWGVPAVTLQL